MARSRTDNGRIEVEDHTDRVALSRRQHRARRESAGPALRRALAVLKLVVAVLGIIGVLVGAGAGLWAAGVAWNEKAPRSRVRALEQRHAADVYDLRTGVHDIQVEQRKILNAVDPDEAKRSPPVPPAPEPPPELEEGGR